MLGRALFALTFCLVLAGARPAAARRYTLDELIAHVTRHYPGVLTARHGVDAAQANVSAAQRLWAPTGDLTFFVTGSPNSACADATGYSHPDKTIRERNCVRSSVVDLARFNSLANAAPIHGVNLNLGVNLYQPLYTFGKNEATIGHAKAGLEAARAAVGAAEADAIYNATRAYWGIKSARTALTVLDDGLKKVDEWIDRIDEELSGANKNKYTESDLARLKIGADHIRILRLDLERQLRYAEAGLRVLTGEEDADVDAEEIDLVDFDERSAGAYAEEMARLRPEARQAAAWSRQAGQSRRLRLAEMLPDLLFWTRLDYAYSSNLDSPENMFMFRPTRLHVDFMLLLRMPLDFGPRWFRLKQAQADERGAKAREQHSLTSWAIDVHRAYADVVEAIGRVKQAKHAEKVARGWYTSIDQGLQTGLYTDGRELAEAARVYFEYRLRYIQALFDANSMVALLERTAGVKAVKRDE
jgi:outer membrane protein TolC